MRWHANTTIKRAKGSAHLLTVAHAEISGDPPNAKVARQVEVAAETVEALLVSGAFGRGPFYVSMTGALDGSDGSWFSLSVREVPSEKGEG